MELGRTLIPMLAIFLASTVYSVNGIYCFQCNSYMDPECTNLKNNDTTSRFYKECMPTDASGGKEMFCRKTVQIIMDRGGISRVIRSCGWIVHPKQECYSSWNKGHEDLSCQCFKDACNSSPITTPHTPFLIGVILSLYHFYKN